MAGADQGGRRPKLGRPSKYTPELGQSIVEALAKGVSMEGAAAASGISKDTLYRWLRAGAREEPSKKRVRIDFDTGYIDGSPTTLADFSDAVKKALARCESHLVGVIRTAAESGNWTAAAWTLERRFPGQWGTNRVQAEEADRRALRELGKAADGSTSLQSELEYLRKRLNFARAIVLSGGTSALPLEKALELEARTMAEIRQCAVAQQDMHPGQGVSGNFVIALEHTGSGDSQPTEANRLPDLEGKAPLPEAAAPAAPQPDEKPVVGATGNPGWDETEE